MSRILWIPSSDPGSLFPAVPIALELTRRGHAVTAMCEPTAERTFTELGFEFRPATSMAEYVASPRSRPDLAARRAWHEGYVVALFDDAQREIATGRYDGCLLDPLEPGPQFAAEMAGLPAASYVHWGLDETATDVPFQFHFWDRLTAADDAFVLFWNQQRQAVGLGPDPRPTWESRWYRCSPSLTLYLGLPELVHPRTELPPTVRRVGPTAWEPPRTAPLGSWIKSLGRDRPAILASVSTIGTKDRELVELIGSSVRDLDVEVIITMDGGDATGLPSNVRLVPFTPHNELMRHVSLVICHAGNGTVNRAAFAGVPMLLLPDGRDRFVVTRGAEAAGVARGIPRSDVNGAPLTEAIRALLHDGSYRERAVTLQTVAARYDAPTAASDAMERLFA